MGNRPRGGDEALTEYVRGEVLGGSRSPGSWRSRQACPGDHDCDLLQSLHTADQWIDIALGLAQNAMTSERHKADDVRPVRAVR